MPSPEQIYQQVVRLTADLVGLSVCNHQNFPSLRDVGRGVKELGLGGKSDLSIALKNLHTVMSMTNWSVPRPVT